MRVHFSTDDLPPRDREEFFVELVAKYVMNMTSGDRPEPAGYQAQFDACVAKSFTLFGYQTPYRTGLRKAADIGRARGGYVPISATSARVYFSLHHDASDDRGSSDCRGRFLRHF